MRRRSFVVAGLLAPLFACSAFADSFRIDVLKSPTCGCCAAWGDHLRAAGFDVAASDVSSDALWEFKARLGVPEELSSRHTARLGRCFVEGRAPAGDIERMIAGQPDGLGLTVPGMPIGRPGMEMGDEKEPFETLLVLRSGEAQVFQAHG